MNVSTVCNMLQPNAPLENSIISGYLLVSTTIYSAWCRPRHSCHFGYSTIKFSYNCAKTRLKNHN